MMNVPVHTFDNPFDYTGWGNWVTYVNEIHAEIGRIQRITEANIALLRKPDANTAEIAQSVIETIRANEELKKQLQEAVGSIGSVVNGCVQSLEQWLNYATQSSAAMMVVQPSFLTSNEKKRWDEITRLPADSPIFAQEAAALKEQIERRVVGKAATEVGVDMLDGKPELGNNLYEQIKGEMDEHSSKLEQGILRSGVASVGRALLQGPNEILQAAEELHRQCENRIKVKEGNWLIRNFFYDRKKHVDRRKKVVDIVDKLKKLNKLGMELRSKFMKGNVNSATISQSLKSTLVDLNNETRKLAEELRGIKPPPGGVSKLRSELVVAESRPRPQSSSIGVGIHPEKRPEKKPNLEKQRRFTM